MEESLMIEEVIENGKVIGKRDEISNAIIIKTPIPDSVINSELRMKESENQKITIKSMYRRMAKMQNEINIIKEILKNRNIT